MKLLQLLDTFPCLLTIYLFNICESIRFYEFVVVVVYFILSRLLYLAYVRLLPKFLSIETKFRFNWKFSLHNPCSYELSYY